MSRKDGGAQGQEVGEVGGQLVTVGQNVLNPAERGGIFFNIRIGGAECRNDGLSTRNSVRPGGFAVWLNAQRLQRVVSRLTAGFLRHAGDL